MVRLLPSALLLGLLLPTGTVRADPTAVFTPHRASTAPGDPAPYASNPAPLYVHFDATGSDCDGDGRGVAGDPQDFLDCSYVWDFGDPLSGTWATSGLSKNAAYGAVAGHVYERAGTFTVTLTVTDSTGSASTSTRNVVVDPADAIWPAHETECVSASGTFTGCPFSVAQGARHTTSSDWDAALSAAMSAGRRRVLFRSSETFHANGRTVLSAGDTGMVGSFGGTARAKVNLSSGAQAVALRGFNGSSPDSRDWRIVGIDCSGSDGANTTCVGANDGGYADHDVDVLVLNVRSQPIGSGNIAFGINGLPRPHDLIAIVDSDLEGRNSNNGSGVCFFGGAERYFFAGNTCDQRGTGTSNAWMWRIQRSRKSIFAHNDTLSNVGAFDNIKYTCLDRSSGNRFNVISDNHFFSGHINLTRGTSTANCQIDYTVFERNWQQDAGAAATEVEHPNWAFRHNVVNFWELAADASSAALVHNNVFTNNICHSTRGGSPTCIVLESMPSSNPSGNVFRNTLAWYPNANSVRMFSDNSGGSGNRHTESFVASSNPFVDATPDSRSDFAPNLAGPQASSIIDAGSSPNVSAVDLGLHTLHGSVGWDIGAWDGNPGSGDDRRDTTPPAPPVLLGN